MAVETPHHAVISQERGHASNSGHYANAPPAPSLQQSFPMAKGDGEDSYSRNSEIQAFINKVPLLALSEVLDRVTLPSNGSPVVVADLGCSSGSNTIVNVAQIVDKLRHRLPTTAEFQAYFNDVPSNDFNNLFQLLSVDGRAKSFYSAGVPGSFYNRLFPKSSVHVFVSTHCLHWMSKIPDAVVDKESPTYNRGEVWYTQSRSAVAEAYQQQALSDLTSFLEARAAELAPGGLLFFCLNARLTSEPNEFNGDFVENLSGDVNEVLTDLIAEGLVTEQQRDSFNFPGYHRSIEDVREAIASCGSLFEIVMNKIEHIARLHHDFVSSGFDAAAQAGKLTGTFKAAYKHQFEAHFDKDLLEVIWQRVGSLVEKKTAGLRPNYLRTCIVGLIRK